jgi:hypothetical protein
VTVAACGIAPRRPRRAGPARRTDPPTDRGARGGTYLVDLADAEIDPRIIGLGTHRGVLFEILLAALGTTPAKLCFDHAIVATHTDAEGRWLVDERGAKHGPFALVVAARARTP